MIRKYTNSKKAKYGTKPTLKEEIKKIIDWRFQDEISFLNERFGIFHDFHSVNYERNLRPQSFLDIVENFSIDTYLSLKGVEI